MDIIEDYSPTFPTTPNFEHTRVLYSFKNHPPARLRTHEEDNFERGNRKSRKTHNDVQWGSVKTLKQVSTRSFVLSIS